MAIELRPKVSSMLTRDEWASTRSISRSRGFAIAAEAEIRAREDVALAKIEMLSNVASAGLRSIGGVGLQVRAVEMQLPGESARLNMVVEQLALLVGGVMANTERQTRDI